MAGVSLFDPSIRNSSLAGGSEARSSLPGGALRRNHQIDRAARTGNRGDGIITVLDVDNVQRMREIEASS